MPNLQFALSQSDKISHQKQTLFSGGNSCAPSVASDHRSSDKFPILFKVEFLRPFGSKRTEFERQIRLNRAVLPNL